MKKVKIFMSWLYENQYFISLMIMSWLYIEYSIAFAIKENVKCFSFFPWWQIVIFVIFLFLFFLKFIVLEKCRLSNITLKKLMSNALGFKWLSLLFILAFMMQLTWFIDAAYTIFINAELSFPDVGKCILTFVSMFIINELFPVPKRKEKGLAIQRRNLLLSAFSTRKKDGKFVIQKDNFDLFEKPFVYKEKGEFPFKEIVIIVSDLLASTEIELNCVDLFPQDKRDEYERRIRKYNDNETLPNERLSEFCKLISELVYYKYKLQVKVSLSDPINFNDFGSIYMEAERQLKIHEKSTENTVVHISPGTSLASCALSTLAIKGNRLLLYTEQGNSTPAIFDIDVFSISELLSELWNEYETSPES